MPVSKNQNDSEFLIAINNTLQQLFEDIKEGEINFATLKVELTSLLSKINELSINIRVSETELAKINIRLALIEQLINHIQEAEKKQTERGNNILVANTQGRWQVITAITVGCISLVGSILTLIMTLIK